MKEARRLLLDTQMDISSIALRLGYSDAVNFIAAFKRLMVPRQVISGGRAQSDYCEGAVCFKLLFHQ